jgi:hypothetical protein
MIRGLGDYKSKHLLPAYTILEEDKKKDAKKTESYTGGEKRYLPSMLIVE